MLYVVTAPGRAETLAALAGVAPSDRRGSDGRRDVMLGEIAFDHPLFAPLAGAQFNDFTKIHFWKYRRHRAGSARRLAASWPGSKRATPPSSRRPTARDGSSSWRAAGSRPTASLRGRRSSSP